MLTVEGGGVKWEYIFKEDCARSIVVQSVLPLIVKMCAKKRRKEFRHTENAKEKSYFVWIKVVVLKTSSEHFAWQLTMTSNDFLIL